MGFNGRSRNKESQQKSNKAIADRKIDKEVKTANTDPFSFLSLHLSQIPVRFEVFLRVSGSSVQMGHDRCGYETGSPVNCLALGPFLPARLHHQSISHLSC